MPENGQDMPNFIQELYLAGIMKSPLPKLSDSEKCRVHVIRIVLIVLHFSHFIMLNCKHSLVNDDVV